MSLTQKSVTIETLFSEEGLWRYSKVLGLSYAVHVIISSIFCNVFRLVLVDGIVNPFVLVTQYMDVFKHPFQFIYDSVLPISMFILLTRIHLTSYTVHLWIPEKRLDYIRRFLSPTVCIKSVGLTTVCTYLMYYYASLCQPSHLSFNGKLVQPCLYDSSKSCVNDGPWIVILSGMLFGIQFTTLYFHHNYNVLTFTPPSQSASLLFKLKLTVRFVLSACSQFKVGISLILLAPFVDVFLSIFHLKCIGHFLGLHNDSSSVDCINTLSNLTHPLLWATLFISSLLLCTTLYAFLTFFSEIVTQPVSLAVGSDDAFSMATDVSSWRLSNGLQSKCLLLKLLSLRHLSYIATDSTPWGTQLRKRTFAISQPGGHPHNWQGILKPTLQLIQDFTLRLKVTNGEKITKNEAKMEEIGSKTIRQPYAAEKRLTDLKKKFTNGLNSILNAPIVKFFNAPLPDSANRKIMAEGQALIWAVQGLAHLVAKSYTTDEYGVVQRDTPEILTTLVQLQQAVDQSVRGFNPVRGGAPKMPFDYSIRKGLKMSTRMALYTISDTYGGGLRELGLPAEVQSKLESYLAFSEGLSYGRQ